MSFIWKQGLCRSCGAAIGYKPMNGPIRYKGNMRQITLKFDVPRLVRVLSADGGTYEEGTVIDRKTADVIVCAKCCTNPDYDEILKTLESCKIFSKFKQCELIEAELVGHERVTF